ncbi:unnamed protein product [Vicia faba]|uniref:Uncharacterized protein n=1 Tax=Vicia faba TaxID=3906 RepID=A0AAV1AI73_VICFA|nr:unnamed protein product [Vicia faba]
MRSMASSRGNIAAIVGVGPNLGLSIARKFAHEGYTVAILARDLGRLSEFADEIAREEKAQVFAIRIDCSDSRSVREAFEAVSSLGAFNCAQQVLPGMVERGKGTILFTGCSASLNGIAGYSELCCGKFALRALSQCLAKEFQPQGVHIAHIIIDGLIGPPNRCRGPSAATTTSRGGGEGVMDPDALAQTYWHLHVQDRNAWTQEIDVRSSNC